MKLIGLGLLCLLSTLAWAEEVLEQVEDLDEVDELYDPNATDFAQPWPIAAAYTGAENVIVLLPPMNWFQANEACAAQGLTLTSIGSQDDQKSVMKDLRDSGALRTIGTAFWTSGSTLANGVHWTWFANGEMVTYTNWASRPATKGNRCLSINPANGKWNSEGCYEKRYIICRCQAE